MPANPSENIGLVCRSLEKYWDVTSGQMDVKSRPILIIGHELRYQSSVKIDYEIMPFSKVGNYAVDEEYDVLIDGYIKESLCLRNVSYIRTNKTSWTNARNIDFRPLSNLKNLYPELFNELIDRNLKWVTTRSAGSKSIIMPT